MQDAFGRTIDYLRLSVTEACNFHCLYCRPRGFIPRSGTALSIKEIERIVRAAVRLGITKIRLTGGEPLLRRDIVEIVHAISSIPGVLDLSMTTNAFRLADLAYQLAEAGLKRVNVSLDTLNRVRFTRIAGADAFERVWDGIRTAERAGLTPIKLNVVALRGINDDEVNAFADLTVQHSWHVRFIELMAIGENEASQEFFHRHFVSTSEMLARFSQLLPVDAPRGNGPARTFRLPSALGTLGFISPASDHFCAACNRIRITAQGSVHPCLFGSDELGLRTAFSNSALTQLLACAIQAKPEHHPIGEGFHIPTTAMSSIGG